MSVLLYHIGLYYSISKSLKSKSLVVTTHKSKEAEKICKCYMPKLLNKNYAVLWLYFLMPNAMA